MYKTLVKYLKKYGILDKFIKNYAIYHNLSTDTAVNKIREKIIIHGLRDFLARPMLSFDWCQSKEGYVFWKQFFYGSTTDIRIFVKK